MGSFFDGIRARYAAAQQIRLARQGGRFAGAPSPRTKEDLDAMAAQETSGYLAPFPASITRDMAAKLWQEIEPFINGAKPKALRSFDLGTAWTELRRRLDLIISGRPPMPPEPREQAAHVPLCLHCRPDGKVYWSTLRPDEPRGAMPRRPRDRAQRLVNEIGGSCVILLWHPDVRRRLRRCEQCGRFALLPRSKGEHRHFCDADCRRAFERSAAGRSAAARRVRQHRERQPRGRTRT
jgi:hypothetical protein